MKVVLRSCPHCLLVYEGDGACPACQADPAVPPPEESEEKQERRKTSQLPVIRKPKTP